MIVAIVIAVLAVLGGLGYVLYQNFLAPKESPVVAEQANDLPLEANIICADGEDEQASEGIFCSVEMGIKFEVPEIFTNTLAVTDNYDVGQGPLDPDDSESAGTSDKLIEAVVEADGMYNFRIAMEPLRTGYIDVPHLLTGTYYDEDSHLLTGVNTPEIMYDAETDTTTRTGEYSIGDTVPSSTYGGVKVFKAVFGDAGTQIVTYVFESHEKLYKVTLNNTVPLGPETSYDYDVIEAVFLEFDDRISTLEV